MCYLIAKDVNKKGCVALKTKHGKNLSEMKKSLNEEIGRRGMQFVTISRPTAYGEYAPYEFAESEDAFRHKAMEMAR